MEQRGWFVDQLQSPVMVRPRNEDCTKAQKEGKPGRPLFPQGMRKRMRGVDCFKVGDFYLENQKGDGDGKYTITKSLEAGSGIVHHLFQ